MNIENTFSRRGFLGVAAGAGIGVATASMLGVGAGTAHAAMSVAGAGTASDSLGIQLYTIRNAVSSRGFRAVFEELSRQGYTHVEFAGYTQGNVGPITTQELRQLLDDNGLKAIGSHVGLNNLLNPGLREAEFERAVILGMPYVGTASDFPGQTVSAVQAGAARFNEAAAVALRDYGVKIYQHNHANEFAFTTDAPDTRRYDVFLAATDPSLVYLEMDILWAFGGARKYAVAGGTNGVPLPGGELGFDPASYVVAQPQRYPLFHTKDGVPLANPAQGNSYDPVEFNTGSIPFRDFFDKVGSNTPHVPIYEQDTAISTPAALGGELGAAERSLAGMVLVRTLSWLDELTQMVDRFAAAGRVTSSAAASLKDRLAKATTLAEQGSESRTAGYVEQFVARAKNQVKGDADARSLLVLNGTKVLAWLQDADDRENAL